MKNYLVSIAVVNESGIFNNHNIIVNFKDFEYDYTADTESEGEELTNESLEKKILEQNPEYKGYFLNDIKQI